MRLLRAVAYGFERDNGAKTMRERSGTVKPT